MQTQNMQREYFTAEDNGERLVKLKGKCVFSGQPYSVTVTEKQLQAYEGGELAQRAFPDLKPHDREFLVSRICPKAWNDTFGEFE